MNTVKNEVIKLVSKKWMSFYAMDQALKTTAASRKFREARQEGIIRVHRRKREMERYGRTCYYNEYKCERVYLQSIKCKYLTVKKG